MSVQKEGVVLLVQKTERPINKNRTTDYLIPLDQTRGPKNTIRLKNKVVLNHLVLQYNRVKTLCR